MQTVQIIKQTCFGRVHYRAMLSTIHRPQPLPSGDWQIDFDDPQTAEFCILGIYRRTGHEAPTIEHSVSPVL